MDDNEGIILEMGDDGTFHLQEQPYIEIACQTKEDYDRLQELLEKGRKYEAEIENK